MNKLNLIKIILVIWLMITKATKAVAVKVATFKVPVIASPKKFLYRLDNRDGKALQKLLAKKGIIVILYKLVRKRTRYGTYFTMPVVNPNEVITACINAEPTKKSRVDIANYILLKAPLTTWATIPAALITPLAGMIEAVNDATTDSEMNAAWFILNPQLKKIMAVVQDAMDLDRIHSEIICEFYGFHVKGKGGKTLQHFEGFTGTITGTVLMLAPVGPKGCCYEWVEWDVTRTIPTIIKTSTYAHCTIAGRASHIPFNISVNAVIGEDVVEQSVIMEVVPK